MNSPTERHGYLVFDLETVPDAELYAPPRLAEGQPRPFPPLHVQQVVAAGAMLLDADHRLLRLWTVDATDEEALLRGLGDTIQRERPTLVTFNGRGFDLPVLVLRSLRHGLTLPWYFEEARYRDRRDESGHIDLCDALALHGASRRSVSLDSAARLIGLPGKLAVDGSQVEPLHRAGQIETIRRYCLADVAQTALLLLRYRLLQGGLDRPAYARAAGELLQALRADGRLDALLQHIDGKKLLPADP